jgi:ubiquinol-cytochrome c reductase cytochrome c subunit
MKWFRAWAGLAAMIAALWLRVGVAGAASVENGKAQFMKFGCWECHGTAGQGTIAGPKLAPDPLPFDTLANFVRTTSRLTRSYRETVLLNESRIRSPISARRQFATSRD